MNIPKYDEIQLPALQILNKGEQLKAKDLEEKLAIHFKLTEEEKNHPYNSGNGPVFLDRINWALSYLNMAGLVSKPKRGVYEINKIGKEVLKTPNKFHDFVAKQIELREK
jgi:restriction system protein